MDHVVDGLDCEEDARAGAPGDGTMGAESAQGLGNPKILGESPEESHVPGPGGSGRAKLIDEAGGRSGFPWGPAFDTHVTEEVGLDLALLSVGHLPLEIDPVPPFRRVV
jgi:hypothetical protein